MSSKGAKAPWQQVLDGYKGAGFWWITGFEGTAIPQIDADEYEWTQHYRFWEEDLELVKQNLGVKYLRYTIPWYLVNPAKGVFKWDWTDRVMDKAAALELELILNPIQFGTPMWMKEEFGNPDYPEYATEYIAELARRYGHQIKFYTPHNEPFIAALFCGDLGNWPPYWKGLNNYTRLLDNICRQIVMSVEAIKQSVPDSVMIHVEAGEYFSTRQKISWIIEDVQLRNERRFLCYDLISGRVNDDHPLSNWLLRYGMPEQSLRWFQDRAIELDVVGVDFYPHCEAWLEYDGQELIQHRDNALNIVQAFKETRDSVKVKELANLPLSMSGLLRQYYKRYGRPVMLTETDFSGLAEHKSLYLEYCMQEIKRLREEGVPVLGYTWWPVLDHLNWHAALFERDHIHPVGLWELQKQEDGTMRRVETVAAATFERMLAQSAEYVSDVAAVPVV
jgi:beta-glucosidase/6-phospho-beta-glucosidase/beta-galactosidase